MHNRQQSQLEQDELRLDAIKAEILEELKRGPGRSQELARRCGQSPGGEFTRLLHELLDSDQISFNWIKGYFL